MMDNVDFHQWFINFLIKNLLAEQLKVKLFPIKNYQKNYTDKLFKNLRKEKYTHLLQTIFGVQIWQMCN